jgi:hypothetical protein
VTTPRATPTRRDLHRSAQCDQLRRGYGRAASANYDNLFHNLTNLLALLLRQPLKSTAISWAAQIARILVSASRPSRLTNTAIETLSTESRFTAERRGNRVATRLKNNLACQSTDGRCARSEEHAS